MASRLGRLSRRQRADATSIDVGSFAAVRQNSAASSPKRTLRPSLLRHRSKTDMPVPPCETSRVEWRQYGLYRWREIGSEVDSVVAALEESTHSRIHCPLPLLGHAFLVFFCCNASRVSFSYQNRKEKLKKGRVSRVKESGREANKKERANACFLFFSLTVIPSLSLVRSLALSLSLVSHSLSRLSLSSPLSVSRCRF